MRRELTSLVIASAVLAGSAFTPVAINEAQAASTVQHIKKETVYVNGKAMMVQSLMVKKETLHSVQDLAAALSAKVSYDKKSQFYVVSKGGKTLKAKAGSNVIYVNGKKAKIGTPPALAGKKLFMAAKTFVQAFGGDILIDANLLISEKGSIKTSTASVNVENKLHPMKIARVNGKYLYSVQDLAKAFSATVTVKGNDVTVKKDSQTITFKIHQNIITANGKSVKTPSYHVAIKGVVYADITNMVNVLGGQMAKMDEGGYMLFTSKLASGDTFNPVWLDSSKVMVSNENEDDSRTLIIDTETRKVVKEIKAADLAVSPDGKHAIYSEETGAVTLIDLEAFTSKVISEDDDIKVDFVWSKDGKMVYFLKGEKNSIVASINPVNGEIKSIFDDKISFKTDLKLSMDGKKVIYLLGKEGKVNPDANGDVDNIDMTGTEAQIYSLDLTAEKPAPMAMTSTKDNKVFQTFLEDGTVVYLSTEPESEDLPILKAIGADNKSSDLVKDKDILYVTVSGGKLMILAAEKDGQVIYEVNPQTAKLTQVAATDLAITSFTESADGTLAATAPGLSGERLVVWKNGKFVIVTK